MALVPAPIQFKLNVTLGCSNDKTMPVGYDLRATTYADAETAAGEILTRLGNVSAGVVVGYTITSKFVNDNYVRPTSDDAEYGEKAQIGGKMLDNPLKNWNVKFPMPKIGIFQGTVGKLRDEIDIHGSVPVIAYSNIFYATGYAYVSDGETAESLEDGMRI